MSGQQLLETAKRGAANYRKALGYASRKFDIDTLQCKESGSTIDNVTKYVCEMMYKDLVVTKSTGDNSDKKENDADLEEEVIIDEDGNNNDDNPLPSTTTSSNSNIDSTQTSQPIPSNNNSHNPPSSSDTNNNLNIQSKDTDKVGSNEGNQLDIPNEWFFPGWFSFLSFGPFVPKEKRLSLLEISDASKVVTKSRAEKRKADKIEKDLKRRNNVMNDRGYNTDQMLQLQLINIQRNKETDISRESMLVGLSIQESALSRQIQQAEDRAICLCPDDKQTHSSVHWKRVDALIKRQFEVMEKISEINEIGLNNQRNQQTTNNNDNIPNSEIPTEIADVNPQQVGISINSSSSDITSVSKSLVDGESTQTSTTDKNLTAADTTSTNTNVSNNE